MHCHPNMNDSDESKNNVNDSQKNENKKTNDEIDYVEVIENDVICCGSCLYEMFNDFFTTFVDLLPFMPRSY